MPTACWWKLGIDYTTFNFSDTSVGVFVPVVESGVLGQAIVGTSWQRLQGGLSLTF